MFINNSSLSVLSPSGFECTQLKLQETSVKTRKTRKKNQYFQFKENVYMSSYISVYKKALGVPVPFQTLITSSTLINAKLRLVS